MSISCHTIARQFKGKPRMDHPSKNNFGPCLYVTNLHPDVDEISLYDKFSEVGPVTSVNLCRDVLTKQSLCYAYIKFKELCDMERALIQLNFAYLNNMPIRVIWSNKSPEVNRLNVGHIFLKNLHIDVDNRELFNIFAQFGNIISCKIVLDNNNKSTGLGFVDFEDERCAEEAIKRVNGMKLGGIKVYAGKYIPRKEVSFHFVRIKNLPDDITENKLKTMFEEIGPINNTKISIYKSGKSHKLGFICFKDLKYAIEAVELFKKKILSDKIKYQGLESEKIELEYVNRFKGSNLYIKSSDNSCYGNGLYNRCFSYPNAIQKKRQSQSYRLVVSREDKQISEETNKLVEEKSSISSLERKSNEKISTDLNDNRLLRKINHTSRTINCAEENASLVSLKKNNEEQTEPIKGDQIINETNCSVGESKLPDKALLKNQDQEIQVCKIAEVTKETTNYVKEKIMEKKISNGTTLTNTEANKQLQTPLQEKIEQEESSKRKRRRSKSKSQPSNVALETNEEQKLFANSNNIQIAKKACHSVREITSQITAENSNHELKLYSNVAATKTASVGESSSSKSSRDKHSDKYRVVASEFPKLESNLIKEIKFPTTDLKKKQKTSSPDEQLHNKSPTKITTKKEVNPPNNEDPKVSSSDSQIHRISKTVNRANNSIARISLSRTVLEKNMDQQLTTTKASNSIKEANFFNPALKKTNGDRKISSNGTGTNNSIAKNISLETMLEKNLDQLCSLSLSTPNVSNSIKEANPLNTSLKQNNENQMISSNGNQIPKIIMTKNEAPKTALEKNTEDPISSSIKPRYNSIFEEIITPNEALKENKGHEISVNFSTVPTKYPNNSLGGTKSSNMTLLKNNASSSIPMSKISTTKIPQKFYPNLPTVSPLKFQETFQSRNSQMALPKMFPHPSCSPILYQPYVVVFAQSPQYPVPPMFQRCLPQPPYMSSISHGKPHPPTLRESILTNSNLDYIKQTIGENIYPKVEFLYPKLAPKITGMLLEQNALLLDMMEDNELLKSQVEEAVLLLRSYSENQDDMSD